MNIKQNAIVPAIVGAGAPTGASHGREHHHRRRGPGPGLIPSASGDQAGAVRLRDLRGYVRSLSFASDLMRSNTLQGMLGFHTNSGTKYIAALAAAGALLMVACGPRPEDPAGAPKSDSRVLSGVAYYAGKSGWWQVLSAIYKVSGAAVPTGSTAANVITALSASPEDKRRRGTPTQHSGRSCGSRRLPQPLRPGENAEAPTLRLRTRPPPSIQGTRGESARGHRVDQDQGLPS